MSELQELDLVKEKLEEELKKKDEEMNLQNEKIADYIKQELKYEEKIKELQEQINREKEENKLNANQIKEMETKNKELELKEQARLKEENDLSIERLLREKLELQLENLQNAHELTKRELITKENEIEKYKKWYKKSSEDYVLEKERNMVDILQKDITIKNLKGLIEKETEKYQNAMIDLKSVNKQLFEKQNPVTEDINIKKTIKGESTEKSDVNSEGSIDNCILTTQIEKLRSNISDMKKNEKKLNSRLNFYKFFSNVFIISAISYFIYVYYNCFNDDPEK